MRRLVGCVRINSVTTSSSSCASINSASATRVTSRITSPHQSQSRLVSTPTTTSASTVTNDVVPIIDLHRDDALCAQAIHRACTQSGFFYIKNHDVPATLIKQTFDVSRAFFAQPLEEKLKLRVNSNGRGYSPFGIEYSDPERQLKQKHGHGDTKEGFAISHDIPSDHPMASRPFAGPNQWPPQMEWRNVWQSYFDNVHHLSHRVTRLIALSLDLPKTYFDQYFTHNVAIARFLRYSPQISKPSEGIFGSGAHSDYGMVTILATDSEPGLQLYLKKSKQWFDVNPIPGTFVVNLGDMLQRWTNDEYQSTIHRVISSTGNERYSIPFFFEPNYDTIVQCLPSCSSPQKPPKYPPIQSGEYLLSKYHTTQAEVGVARKSAPSN